MHITMTSPLKISGVCMKASAASVQALKKMLEAVDLLDRSIAHVPAAQLSMAIDSLSKLINEPMAQSIGDLSRSE